MGTQQEIEGTDKELQKQRAKRSEICYLGGRSWLQPVSTLLSGSCGFSKATVVPIVFT